jgi:hypothetical protein
MERRFAVGVHLHAELARYDKKSGQFVPYLGGISAADVNFSPDGQWVAYSSFPEGQLWHSRIDGSEKLPLTVSSESEAWQPVAGRNPDRLSLIPARAGGADLSRGSGRQQPADSLFRARTCPAKLGTEQR